MTRWKWESYKTLDNLKNRLCELKKQGNTFKIKVLDTNINTTNNVDEIIQIISRYGVFNNGIYTLAEPININQINVWLKNKKAICINVAYNNINKQIAEESIAFYS